MATKSRRRVLKGLSATLPVVWARPVVKAVVLPAHAEMSTDNGADSGSEPVYSLLCEIEDIRINNFTMEDGDFLIDFSYTPIDSSGTLNGQQVTTVYTAYDAFDAVIFGPHTVNNSAFNDQALVTFIVGPPEPPGAYTVTVEFDDQSTYGTASCSSTDNAPAP